jgi:hypothetical protein
MTPLAIARAARVGDGWLALARLDDLDVRQLGALLEQLHGARAEDRGEPETVLRVLGIVDARSLDGAIASLKPIARLGFDEVAIDLPWPAFDEVQHVLTTLAEALV